MAQSCDPWGVIASVQWNETFSCENDPDAIYITQDDYISNYFTFGSFLSNECIVVEGVRLYIDEYSIINNCTFVMKGGEAKIVVLEGVDAYIMNSQISSGDLSMWDGIEVRKAANLSFLNNKMNDARNGIYNTGSDCSMIVSGNYFNRNLYSLKVGLSENSQDNVVLGLKGNMFNSTSSLKYTVYEGDMVASLSQPRAAIVINGVDLISEHTGCEFSYINNHSNGIIAYNSNISLRNYIFQNINREPQDAVFNTVNEGNAIALNQHRLMPEIGFTGTGKEAKIVGFNAQGMDPPSFATMENVDRGINYALINLTATKLSINGCNLGISGRTRISDTEIINNEIEGVKEKGIELFGIQIGGIKVKDNEIVTHSTEGDNSIGIDLNYVLHSALVEGNSIYESGKLWAISQKVQSLTNKIE